MSWLFCSLAGLLAAGQGIKIFAGDCLQGFSKFWVQTIPSVSRLPILLPVLPGAQFLSTEIPTLQWLPGLVPREIFRDGFARP